MPWIMELRTVRDGVVGWYGIHPSGRDPKVYSYETRNEAARMLNICYPDQCREARLGAEPVVRIREVEIVPPVGDRGPE